MINGGERGMATVKTVVQYGCRRCGALEVKASAEGRRPDWGSAEVTRRLGDERGGLYVTWHECADGGQGLLYVAGWVVQEGA
jgi:hypothetical protein